MQKSYASRLARLGFPGGTVVRNLPASAEDIRDTGSIPGLGRSPGVGNGNPFVIWVCTAMLHIKSFSPPPPHLPPFFFKATPCSLWDLNALTRNWIWPSAVREWSPNHWMTREFPPFLVIRHQSFDLTIHSLWFLKSEILVAVLCRLQENTWQLVVLYGFKINCEFY